MKAELIHATTVALTGAAVLLRGASGSGKSDLGLRLIDRGWSLVADDQTAIQVRGGVLFATAPDSIEGKIEVRGLGIKKLPITGEMPVRLIVDLKPRHELERLPEPQEIPIAGVSLPLIACDPFDSSTPIKLELALSDAVGTDRENVVEDPKSARKSENGDVILVTGLSGAGRSTALKILEDCGFEAVDNLPLDLLPRLVSRSGLGRKLAVGIDIRSRDFAAEPFLDQIQALTKRWGLKPRLLFFDCSNETLIRRFMATRRPHPLAGEDRPVADGIDAERRLLQPLRENADFLFDSSTLSPTALGQALTARLGLEDRAAMLVFITSFSFREGVPRDADFLFDVRFLANPHYETDLKPLSGRDTAVSAFVARDAAFAPFLENLEDLLVPVTCLFEEQGKSYLTVAIGCTGGRHRSVAMAEALAARLMKGGTKVAVLHRDIERDGKSLHDLKGKPGTMI